jgi:hypothetical protein
LRFAHSVHTNSVRVDPTHSIFGPYLQRHIDVRVGRIRIGCCDPNNGRYVRRCGRVQPPTRVRRFRADPNHRPSVCARDNLTRTVDRDCDAISGCAPTEYALTPATRSSDTVCADLRQCTSTEYQIRAPTLSSDRECSTVRLCVRDAQWESAAPTATSNRQCTALTTCSAFLYEAIPPTVTSDR